MKFKAKALLGLLVGCMVLISQTSVRAQESMFVEPIFVEMELTQYGTWGKLNYEKSVNISNISVIYVSENWWYRETLGETIGENPTPIIKKELFDGTFKKTFVKFLNVPENSNNDSVLSIEEGPINPQLRDINPLEYALFPYQGAVLSNKRVLDGRSTYALYSYKRFGQIFDGEVVVDSSGQIEKPLLLTLYDNENNQDVIIECKHYNKSFNDRVFPSLIEVSFV